MPKYSQASNIHTSTNDPRFIGDLMGSYLLQSRAKSLSGIRVFACRARSISPDTAVVDAPVIGEPGEALTATFDTLGILRGHIQRPLGGGRVAPTDYLRIATFLGAARVLAKPFSNLDLLAAIDELLPPMAPA